MRSAIRSLLAAGVLGSALVAQSPLCTGYAGTTYVATGTTYFDLTVLSTNAVIVGSFEINTNAAAGTPFQLDVYVTAAGSTFVGNELVPGAWTLVGSAFGSASGNNVGSPVDTPDFVLQPGTTYGIALHHVDIAPLYLPGAGAPTNTYSTADLRIDLGSVGTGAAGTGTLYTPRYFQGCVHYTLLTGLQPNFVADKTYVGPGESVQFSDSSFTTHPGGIIGWDWDLNGDGVFGDSAVQNPIYTYSAANCGPVDVSLTAIDAGGTATTTKVGYVTVGAPVPSFTFTLSGGPLPNPFLATFTDTSTAMPTSWDWDFDNDGVSDYSGQTPPPWPFLTAAYNAVTLTTANACGSASFTDFVDTRTTLCTLFAQNNGGGDGGAVYFDAEVLSPTGITINSIDLNSDIGGNTPVSIDVYCKRGTYTGNESNVALWSKVVTGAGSFSRGADLQTSFDVPDFCLPQGINGIGIVIIGDGHRYTTGTGITIYQNADLRLVLGSATAPPFSSTVFTPRIANLCIGYEVGGTQAAFTMVGAGCRTAAGKVPTLGIQGGGGPVSGSPITFTVQDAPASTPIAGLFIGFAPLSPPIDLGVIGGKPGCALYTDPGVTLPLTVDAIGSATAPTFSVPLGTGGLTFYAEAAFGDLALPFPLPVVFSDTHAGLIGCY